MLTNLEQPDTLELEPELVVEQPAADFGFIFGPSTVAEVVRYCRTLADALNATEFSVLYCLPGGDGLKLAPVCDSAFPGVSTLSRTMSSGAPKLACTSLLRQPAPVWWRAAGTPHFLTPDARRWAREVAAPIEDSSGIAFPVSAERGRSGFIVFTGQDMTISEVALCETHARCHKTFADLSQRRTGGVAVPSMSRREIECLRLTAHGQTSEEIANTLGLSVHTANQYLTNSTHKLNAVNRIHAVAKALRTGLID